MDELNWEARGCSFFSLGKGDDGYESTAKVNSTWELTPHISIRYIVSSWSLLMLRNTVIRLNPLAAAQMRIPVSESYQESIENLLGATCHR